MNKNIKLLVESIFDDNADIFNPEKEYLDDMYNIISSRMKLPYTAKLKIILFDIAGIAKPNGFKFVKADPENQQYEQFIRLTNYSWDGYTDRCLTYISVKFKKIFKCEMSTVRLKDIYKKTAKENIWHILINCPDDELPLYLEQISIKYNNDITFLKNYIPEIKQLIKKYPILINYPFISYLYTSPDDGILYCRYIYEDKLTGEFKYAHVITFTGLVNYSNNKDIMGKSARKKEIDAEKQTKLLNILKRKFYNFIKRDNYGLRSFTKLPLFMDYDNYPYMQYEASDGYSRSFFKGIKKFGSYTLIKQDSEEDWCYLSNDSYLEISSQLTADKKCTIIIKLTNDGKKIFDQIS